MSYLLFFLAYSAEYVQSWIEELLRRDTPVTGEVSLLFSELAMLRLHLDSLIQEFLDLERDRLDVLKIQYRHLTHAQQSVYRRLHFKRPHLLASLHATHSLLISHCTHPGYTIPPATFTFLPSCFRHRELCLLCLGPHFKLSS